MKCILEMDDSVLGRENKDEILSTNIRDENDKLNLPSKHEFEIKISFCSNILISNKVEGRFTNYFKSKATKDYILVKKLYDEFNSGKSFGDLMDLHDHVIEKKSKETRSQEVRKLLTDELKIDVNKCDIYKFYEKGKYEGSKLRVWVLNDDSGLKSFKAILIDPYHMLYPARENYIKQYEKSVKKVPKYELCLSSLVE